MPRTLRSDLDRLHSQVASAVAAEPFTATAAAAGIGFVLGGGLTRSTIALLAGTAARIAATWLGEEVRLRAAQSFDSAEEVRG